MVRNLFLFAACTLTLAACGPREEAPKTSGGKPAATVIAAAAPAAPENEAGKKVYGIACATCHAAGVAGAPKPGDKADWQPRIAQGTEVLYKHALEGFTGAKGMMPAKGGQPNLPDADVKTAVDYMVALSR